MNEDDADETTRLMSVEFTSQSLNEEDRSSRDRRHHRQRETDQNVYPVRF